MMVTTAEEAERFRGEVKMAGISPGGLRERERGLFSGDIRIRLGRQVP